MIIKYFILPMIILATILSLSLQYFLPQYCDPYPAGTPREEFVGDILGGSVWIVSIISAFFIFRSKRTRLSNQDRGTDRGTGQL